MPRNSDPLAELFDRIRVAASGWAQDMLDDATRNLHKHIPPRAPRQRRVNGKGPKKAKAPRRNPAWTHYDTLEISRHASTETIRAAWVSLCKRNHPDVAKHKGAAERMKQINAAWEILGDEKKRAAYNREIGLTR